MTFLWLTVESEVAAAVPCPGLQCPRSATQNAIRGGAQPSVLENAMHAPLQPEISDAKAVRMVKLIRDLDSAIRGLRRLVPASKPWQRALLAKLDDADRQMQVLRMMEAMEKSDVLIAEATVQLGSSCRRVALAVQGSRADAFVRSGAVSIAKAAAALTKLVLEAVPP